MRERELTISVVVPCFNESACILELIPRIEAAFQRCAIPSFEILIIDNGSTLEERSKLQIFFNRPNVRIIALSRNFGYQGALWAGLDHAAGEAVVFIDGDGEDPPEVIEQFIKKWREGYLVVYGVRLSRKVSWVSRVCYWAFYRVLDRLSNVRVPLDAGEFSLVSGPALQALKQFQDRTRMLRILRAWIGFDQAPVYYHREARISGKSKFNFFSAISFAWDGFVAVTDIPVRLSILCSTACFVVSIVGIGYYFFWYFLSQEKIPGFASLNITILLLFSVLFLCLGVLSKYILSLLDETRKRPPYIVAKKD